MTNFDIFLSEPKFASFTEVAVSADKMLNDELEAFKIKLFLSSMILLTKHNFCLTA